MNTNQINKVLFTDKYTRKIFGGTYPIDKLPKRVQYPSCFVINNQPSYQTGEHWVAVYFTKNKNAVFFDSYGNNPSFYKLTKFVKNNSKMFEYNHKQIQSYLSEYCGYYCLLFLLFISRENTLTDFLSFFKNPVKNDLMIKNFLKNY
jgi:hypothetical protein